MTFTDRIRFTVNGFKQAWYEGLVEATMKAMHFAENPAKRRASIIGVTGLLFGARALPAGAANPCPSNAAQSNLVSLFKRIGLLLYVIGGVFCLVCFAGAAIMFMASGNNASRADKAMKWAKNTVIGIAILAGGLFMRSIIVHFVAGSGQMVSGDSGSTGSAANNLTCDNLNNVTTTP